MESYYLELLISIALLLNIIASVKVWKTDYFEEQQKIAQMILIFVIPFFASIGVLLFLHNESKPVEVSTDRAGKGHCSINSTDSD